TTEEFLAFQKLHAFGNRYAVLPLELSIRRGSGSHGQSLKRGAVLNDQRRSFQPDQVLPSQLTQQSCDGLARSAYSLCHLFVCDWSMNAYFTRSHFRSANP